MNPGRTKKTLYLSMIMFLLSLSQVIVNIFLARSLTKSEFGTYRTIFLYFTILSTFFTYSISPSILYFFSRYPEYKEKYLSSCTLLLILSSLLVSACFYILSFGWFGFNQTENMNLFFKVYAIYSVFSISSAYFIQLLIAENNFKKLVQYVLLIVILRVANVVFIVIKTKSLVLFLYGMCFVELIHFLYVVANSRHVLKFGTVKKDVLKEIVIYSFPIALATLLSILSSEGGKLVITWMTTKEAFAVYALGSTEIPLLRTITFSAGNIILPDVTRLYIEEQYDQIVNIWRSSVVKLSLLLIPITIFLCAHASDLIVTLFSDKYLDSVPIFKFYVLVIPLEVFLYQFFFRATGKVKYIYYSALLLTTGTFIFTFVAAKYFGILGAAISRVILMYAYVTIQMTWMAKILKRDFFELIDVKDIVLIVFISLIANFLSSIVRISQKEVINFIGQGSLFLIV